MRNDTAGARRRGKALPIDGLGVGGNGDDGSDGLKRASRLSGDGREGRRVRERRGRKLSLDVDRSAKHTLAEFSPRFRSIVPEVRELLEQSPKERRHQVVARPGINLPFMTSGSIRVEITLGSVLDAEGIRLANVRRHRFASVLTQLSDFRCENLFGVQRVRRRVQIRKGIQTLLEGRQRTLTPHVPVQEAAQLGDDVVSQLGELLGFGDGARQLEFGKEALLPRDPTTPALERIIP